MKVFKTVLLNCKGEYIPYKLIYFEGNKSFELYNINKDPLEKINIIGLPDSKNTFLEMNNEIKKHLNYIEKTKIKLKLKSIKKFI